MTTKHDKLLTHFRGYLIGRDYYKAQKALAFMMDRLDGQFRKDGVTPAWAHSLQVAALVRTYPITKELHEQVICIAILHDVVEDTHTSIDTISRFYGSEVSAGVRLLTKESGYDNDFYYGSISGHWEAAIVKGADRICNLMTMVGVFSPEKIANYVAESEGFVLPMIKRAKRNWPEYEAIFEGQKLIINTQLDFAREVVLRAGVQE